MPDEIKISNESDRKLHQLKTEDSTGSSQLNDMSRKIIKTSIPMRRRTKGKKYPWKTSEDEQLLELFKKYGSSWSKIGNIIGNRSGKQVRDRYRNYLRAGLNCDDFTQEEDDNVLSLCEKFGRRWSVITRYMPGRSEGQVKNRYYVYLKKTLEGDDPSEIEFINLKKEEYIENKPAIQKVGRPKTRKEAASTQDAFCIDANTSNFLSNVSINIEIFDDVADFSDSSSIDEYLQDQGTEKQRPTGVKEEHGKRKEAISIEVINNYQELLSRKKALDFFYAEAMKDIVEFESRFDVSKLKID